MHGDLSYFDVADTSRRAGRGQMGEEKGGSGLIHNTNTAGERIFLCSLFFFMQLCTFTLSFNLQPCAFSDVSFDQRRRSDDNNNTCMCV